MIMIVMTSHQSNVFDGSWSRWLQQIIVLCKRNIHEIKTKRDPKVYRRRYKKQKVVKESEKEEHLEQK